jgi:hypothetical protein
MVDWATVCKPKEYGGLGVLNTRLMNIALMLKWIWKLYQGAEGLWVDILKAKHLGDRDLFAHETPREGSNSGVRCRRSSGTSSWEPGTTLRMGIRHTFG